MTANDRHPGGQNIFEELMSFHEQIFVVCLGFSKNLQDAEELTQDVFLKAYENIDSVKDPSLARQWLFRIARNTCLDHGKRNRQARFVSLTEAGESAEWRSPEGESIQRDELRILKEAMEHLPGKLREVFVLRHYGELSYAEIASVLKTKIGTVMSRLNRARQRVMARIREARDEK